uniref:Putative attractin n=1 Tax=Phlebotomus kandelakii TaxID=1109342 RepID=A0A6B2E548_9DIPT
MNLLSPLLCILGPLPIFLCVEVSGIVPSNCPNNCNVHLGQGICNLESKKCLCSVGFEGEDCLKPMERTVPTPELRQSVQEFNASQCTSYQTCSGCSENLECGWCDDGSRMGLGKCFPGGESGPEKGMKCPINRWYFTYCPSCQCNGHSTCSDGYSCEQPCGNFTTGPDCNVCAPGYWGNPVNGGSCQPCDCNGYATNCNSQTGKCFCTTKGVIGHNCEICDVGNNYYGDPIKRTCYYNLTIDYEFTFNLSKKSDLQLTQINFSNFPLKFEYDTYLIIETLNPAKMNITFSEAREAGSLERTILTDFDTSEFTGVLTASKYRFGIIDGVPLTTFYVYMYDLKPPLWIRIAFSQYPQFEKEKIYNFIS